MTFDKNVEFISIFLTATSVYLAFRLLLIWTRPTLDAFKTEAKYRDGGDWMMIGVWYSFVGALFDNIYWGIAWVSNMKALPFRDFLFTNGALANIPFRNIPLILAVYYHIKGFYALKHSLGNRAKRVVLEGILFASIICSLVVYFL